MLLYSSGACMLGMRRKELSKLKYKDYDESTQSTKISGKKKKERLNFLQGNVLVAFNDWITIRSKTSGPLFNPINKGNNMLRVGITPTGTFNFGNRRRKQGGVDKFSPHDLRRSRRRHDRHRHCPGGDLAACRPLEHARRQLEMPIW
ncbi:MAG: hypothetical protein C0401_05645, partial [Anaerolinea sp.]|nr:hypothetical protein [Anaerolinea sp.]